ncbi:unnamed protein product [Caenorhabditis auriculariae]|uniref:Uncharacterized protein n=1 Tax=Caenorhabditis auriculariae TaxID=2777116 RepID=A0A8S1GVT4_9PELO|nr:unnamed protein product [Caenorhabditis auriculariae]
MSSARNSVASLSSNGSAKVETRLTSGHNSRLGSIQQEGAMLPSSSSKDDDLLSTSSDEVENAAMRTLQHMEETKSIVANKSDDDSIFEEKKEIDEKPEKGKKDDADTGLRSFV